MKHHSEMHFLFLCCLYELNQKVINLRHLNQFFSDKINNFEDLEHVRSWEELEVKEGVTLFVFLADFIYDAENLSSRACSIASHRLL